MQCITLVLSSLIFESYFRLLNLQKERDRLQKKLERRAFRREKLTFAQTLLTNHFSEDKEKAKRPNYWTKLVSAAWKSLYNIDYVLNFISDCPYT